MEQISPESSWPEAFRTFFGSVSSDDSAISLQHLGFPDDWQTLSIWNSPLASGAFPHPPLG
jgi:hypothetical protein